MVRGGCFPEQISQRAQAQENIRSIRFFPPSRNLPKILLMPDPSQIRGQFASDNYAGICPEAFASMAEANQGHEVSYGNDNWTAKASNLIRDVFETNCEVFFLFNGTAANSLSLASLCQSFHSI